MTKGSIHKEDKTILGLYLYSIASKWALPGALAVKNPSANAGDIRVTGSIPRPGRSPEEGKATHSSILAWRIPWIEKPDGPQSVRSHRVRALCEANSGQSRSTGGDRQHLDKICLQCLLL